MEQTFLLVSSIIESMIILRRKLLNITNTVSIIVLALLLISCTISESEPEPVTYNTIKVFQAWSGVENLEHLSYWEQLAKHSLVFNDTYPLNHATWNPEAGGPQYRGLFTDLNQGSLEEAAQINQELKLFNPDLKLLVSLMYREGSYKTLENEGVNWWEKGHYPPESPYWLKDTNGNHVIGWGEDTNLNGVIDSDDEVLNYLIDFSNSEVQELISKKARSIYNSGLFDGIFLDWMSEYTTTDDPTIPGYDPILSQEEELAARISLIQKIRDKTGPEFLIMGNTNYQKREILTPMLNAVFMECHKSPYYGTYTFEVLKEIQEAVIYNQNTLLPPALVCLEGWRICEEYDADKSTRINERNSEENLKMMRFFTTMSLTLTDGYVLFGDDNAIPHWDHSHNWYDFWDAPLGNGVSDYQTLYQNIPGLYYREFENGWVIHNLTGVEQEVILPARAQSIVNNKLGKEFSIPDRDGDIFLKSY